MLIESGIEYHFPTNNGWKVSEACAMPCYHLKTDDPDRSLNGIARDRDGALVMFGKELGCELEKPGNVIYPCLEHKTISDVLESKSVSWKYYTPGEGSLWTAPDAIKHICGFPNGGTCVNRDFTQHVDVTPSDVLVDIANCNLRAVSWVIPDGKNSDHAGVINHTGGPKWVASIVNAIGNSACKDGNGLTYWQNTAIVITWDDWGGWDDHEPPTFLPFPEGGYQYGFRVPMIFASAYTPAGYINNTQRFRICCSFRRKQFRHRGRSVAHG